GTVWDVEQFESLFMAQAAALGAVSASPADIETVKKNRKRYLEKFQSQGPGDEEELHSLYEEFAESFLSCTHNKLFLMMGEVLFTLRMWRSIEGLEAWELIKTEEAVLNLFVEALESGNPDRAAELMKKVYPHNGELEKLLRRIPAGTVPEIPAKLFREVYLRDK
ncbi:MAG: FCD domain-containing protein, partial [Spirochaetales bacterium]|nr:FCD domain-containing protein [Spirochaetales bacterium]